MHLQVSLTQRWSVAVFALFASWLGGCSSIVAERISSQGSYSYDWFISDAQLADSGFTERRYCSVQTGLCLSYLQASATQEEHFEFEGVINGDPIRLNLSREDTGRSPGGTVVLLHGFAISKEYMAMTASYFRFLGYDVLVPDLLGHGESGGRLGFGVADSRLLDELLNHVTELERPLLVFGNSMGAVAATYLAAGRADVDGLILQAPMLPFDSAAFNYIRFDSPLVATLVTEGSIRKGAVKALQKVSVDLEQTDIRPLLAELDLPVLILVSSTDTVSPPAFFEPLQFEHVTMADVGPRNHYSMVVIDASDSAAIVPWLEDRVGAFMPSK